MARRTSLQKEASAGVKLEQIQRYVTIERLPAGGTEKQELITKLLEAKKAATKKGVKDTIQGLVDWLR